MGGNGLKRALRLLGAYLLGCVLLGAQAAGCAAEIQSLTINEIVSQNKTLWTDDLGLYSDYVELYNPTGADIPLAGWTLSDGGDAHVFDTDAVVPAGGYLLLPLSGRDAGGLHAPFKLSAGGAETVSLSDPQGNLAESVQVPALGEDNAFSRQSGGGFAITPATPGAENAVGEIYVAPPARVAVLPPTLSCKSGFYDEPFTLSMSAPAGCAIVYTLDCEIPGIGSTRYRQPIEISDASKNPNVFANFTDISTKVYTPPAALVDKATIVRAATIDQDGNMSDAVTAVYFVGYQDKKLYGDIAVVSLVTDEESLFDADTGIYAAGTAFAAWRADPLNDPDTLHVSQIPANFLQSGRAWERRASLTYFDAEHAHMLTQDIGIRIHGNTTPKQFQKSFNLYARKEYGAGAFNYRFFDLSLDQLVLRTSRSYTEYLRDPLWQTFFEGCTLMPQPNIPCAVFLNGEYWGLYYLRTRPNERLVAETYGVDEDDVVIIKNNDLSAGSVFGYDDYNDMLAFVRSSDMRDPANYARLCELIDLQSYIDYFCIEIYAGNADWPVNNTMLWKTMQKGDGEYADGRWRWILYDLDHVMGYGDEADPALDSLQNALRNTMFRKLWENEMFRAAFRESFIRLANQYFQPDRCVAMLRDLHERMTPHFNAQRKRFDTGSTQEKREEQYLAFANFLRGRLPAIAALVEPGRVLWTAALTENLPGAGDYTVDGWDATLVDGQWTGQFFKDESITLTVAAREGYWFSHWESGGEQVSDEPSLALVMDGDRDVRAVFYALAEKRSPQDALAAGGASVEQGGDGWSLSSQDWQLGDGVCFTLDMTRCERAVLMLTLGGGRKAPRDLALAYSLDGQTYTEIPGAAIVQGDEQNVCLPLPDACCDRTLVHLRLSVASGFCVSGKERLIGSDEGKLTLENVRVEAATSAVTFAAYRALAQRAEALAAAHPELTETLTAFQPTSDTTQRDIDGATNALSQQMYLAQLRDHTQSLEEFAKSHDISAQIALTDCADAKVYELTPALLAYGEEAYLPAPFAGDARAYRYENGAFRDAGVLRRTTGAQVRFPREAGLYLLLEKPIEAYAVISAVVAPYAPSQAVVDARFSGVAPEGAWLLTIDAVQAFTGEYALPASGWQGGSLVWCYRLTGDTLTLAGEARFAAGEIALTGLETGQYALLERSLEEYARLAAYKQQAQAAPTEHPQEKTGGKEGMRAFIAPAVALALCALVCALVIIRHKSKSKNRRNDP